MGCFCGKRENQTQPRTRSMRRRDIALTIKVDMVTAFLPRRRHPVPPDLPTIVPGVAHSLEYPVL